MLRTEVADKVEALKRYMVALALNDYADLSSFVADVRVALDIGDPEELRETTVGVVRDLIADGLVTPGTPTLAGGFEPWGYDAERAARAIDSYWLRLGRTPELGEIVWFRATDRAGGYVADYPFEEANLGLDAPL